MKSAFLLLSALATIAAAISFDYDRPKWSLLSDFDRNDIFASEQNVATALNNAEKTLTGRQGIDDVAAHNMFIWQRMPLIRTTWALVSQAIGADANMTPKPTSYPNFLKHGYIPANILSRSALQAAEDEYMLGFTAGNLWLEQQDQVEHLVKEAARILGDESAIPTRVVASIADKARLRRDVIPFGQLGHFCLHLVREHLNTRGTGALKRPSNEKVRDALDEALEPWQDDKLSKKQKKKVISEIGNRWMHHRANDLMAWFNDEQLLEEMAKVVAKELKTLSFQQWKQAIALDKNEHVTKLPFTKIPKVNGILKKSVKLPYTPAKPKGILKKNGKYGNGIAQPPTPLKSKFAAPKFGKLNKTPFLRRNTAVNLFQPLVAKHMPFEVVNHPQPMVVEHHPNNVLFAPKTPFVQGLPVNPQNPYNKPLFGGLPVH